MGQKAVASASLSPRTKRASKCPELTKSHSTPAGLASFVTKPDFTNQITPDMIAITDTGKGKISVAEDLLAHDFAVAVDEPKNSEEHEHHWREGKHCVIGQSRSQLGRFILQPLVERSLKQADEIRQYVGSDPRPPLRC